MLALGGAVIGLLGIAVLDAVAADEIISAGVDLHGDHLLQSQCPR